MPSIQISTVPLKTARRRAIAIQLTRWLSAHGVPPAHVIVQFTEIAPGTVFSGGLPLDALPGWRDGRCHAVVTCSIDPGRDQEFRTGLAAELARVLGPAQESVFLYIEFRLTPPGQVYLAGSSGPRRADELAITISQERRQCQQRQT
jgi:phenylpyruvate tautomerase PptA (4-oxalocrotonate tautomerase family)